MKWIAANTSVMWHYLQVHVALSLPALLLAVAVCLPLGWWAARHPRWGRLVTEFTGLWYAIPALPLLVAIPLLFRVRLRDPLTLVIMLTIYAIALLLRSTADAFGSVEPAQLEAARATGHGRLATFLRVELPLALPVALAGVRVAAMSTIGLTTIGALVGIPSLGSLFTDGFQRGIAGELWAGVILTLVLAGAVDLALIWLGRRLAPWRRATTGRAGA
ncbi:ABC transporter permease [Buchananella felis]|uniref:ABC transporter permease n=1 Tax=Buchananella felis TaxID=3231492 RepID=UPI0035293F54